MGDKFASRHGQKGTNGEGVPASKLPRCVGGVFDGLTPDIIMNPIAFPSRMTIGHLIEGLVGTSVAITSKLARMKLKDLWSENVQGHLRRGITKKDKDFFSNPTGDGTPFRFFDEKFQEVKAVLQSHGIDALCDVQMVHPETGEKLTALIFTSMIYYQRLKHIVKDKMHSCAHAARAAITHQPVEGRSNQGAFKIGGMERDCMAASGVSAFLRDRLLEQSDDYKMWICNRCGLAAVVSKDGSVKECKLCETDDVSLVRIPYGAKLVTQELMGMGVVGRILTPKYEDAELKVKN